MLESVDISSKNQSEIKQIMQQVNETGKAYRCIGDTFYVEVYMF